MDSLLGGQLRPLLGVQMGDVSRQIKRLKSPSKNVRYDACEELRVAQGLTEEAIAALRLACEDADPLVANAALAALITHTASQSPSLPGADNSPPDAAPADRLLGDLAIVGILAIGLPLAGATAIQMLGGITAYHALTLLQYSLIQPLGYVGYFAGNVACSLDIALILSPLPAALVLGKGDRHLGYLVAAASGVIMCLAISFWISLMISS